MAFNDDEALPSDPRPTPIFDGRVVLDFVPLEDARFEDVKKKVWLCLKGSKYSGDRSGLDLVAVLDVSGSMGDDCKIDMMKSAMRFVIQKLSPIDRLSIVVFSNDGERRSELRSMTEASKQALFKIVDDLKADGATNIKAGLLTALQVLAKRRTKVDRVVSIMLMSDGQQTDGDAAEVDVSDVPVYTFGFGRDIPKVLTQVAVKSLGGVPSVAFETDGLTKAFSQIIAGLLSVVVQNLKLKVVSIPGDSTIESITAGSYPKDAIDNGFIVKFGNLFSEEERTVCVDLLLPPTDVERTYIILDAVVSYEVGGLTDDAGLVKVPLFRSNSAAPGGGKAVRRVEFEEVRLKMVSTLKEAMGMAGENLDEARDKLTDATNSLNTPLFDDLRVDLQNLISLMQDTDTYQKQGLVYALSSETSHDRQRYAARGNVNELRLFATERMNQYLKQANEFDEDSSILLPSVDEDDKKDLAANPLAPISGPISSYIKAAIQALQSIERLINNGAKR